MEKNSGLGVVFADNECVVINAVGSWPYGEYAVKADIKFSVANTKVAKLGKPSLSKVAACKRSFKATWKSVKSIDSYQLQYSTNKNFKKGNKTITVKGYKSTSKTVKSLKAKKKYYVRIRVYKMINGKLSIPHGVKPKP